MTKFRKTFLLLADICLFYLSLIFTLKIRFWQEFNLEVFCFHFLPFSILYFLWLISFYIMGLYDLLFLKNLSFFNPQFLGAFGICFLEGVIFFYFLPFFKISPKTILIFHLLILFFLIFYCRKILSFLFSIGFQKKIAFWGETKESQKLAHFLKENSQLGYKVVSFLDPKKENFFKKIQKEKIDILILVENFPFLEKFFSLKVKFLTLIEAYEIFCQKIPVTLISPLWIRDNLKEKPIYEKTKRIFEFFLALFFLFLTLPLWGVIALAIKIEDRGPVFYFQKRVGKNKKIFQLIKFRSMIVEAEKEGPKWADLEDKRVTKVGKILRRLHLDELPQMINIIRGELSFVGPRPERPEFVEKLEKEIPYYNLRHIISPGFTGWAQIKFKYARSVKDSLEKFQYDLYYLKNRSFLLDLKIIFQTIQLFLK